MGPRKDNNREARMTTSDRCSLLARASGEPMAGTAEPVDCWLMLEYRGAWNARALEDNTLPGEVRQWLEASVAALSARGLKTRPQLIRRQHNRNRDELSLFVAFADPVQPRLYEFQVEDYLEYASLDLLMLLDDASRYEAGRIHGERYFTCTNGQRDACCAIFGMRVYAELARQADEVAWQTTHLGGHRFAATLVSLPSGAVYGQLTPLDVAPLLEAGGRGELLLSRLRGRSGLDQPAQVAEAQLRHRTGRTALDRYRLVDSAGDDGLERRVFEDTVDGSRHEIRLKAGPEPLRFHASCGEDALKSRWLYGVLS